MVPAPRGSPATRRPGHRGAARSAPHRPLAAWVAGRPLRRPRERKGRKETEGMKRVLSVLALGFLVAGCSAIDVKGIVRDDRTGEPLPGAAVQIGEDTT